jgi:hypothetical protein
MQYGTKTPLLAENISKESSSTLRSFFLLNRSNGYIYP